MNANFWIAMILLILLISPVLAADDAAQENNAWYWYNKAVDLAYAGQYSDALAANEKALAINSTMPVAWANEAGILVQLQRYDEAIAASDKVLSVSGTDMPNTYAAAWYSRGDALRALGRTAEAKEAYAKAYALDNTLTPPDLSADTPRTPAVQPTSLQTQAPVQGTTPHVTEKTPSAGIPPAAATTQRSPLSAITCTVPLILAALLFVSAGRSSR